jgi:hypothetical protein
LPADADLGRQGFLIEAEFPAVIADEGSEIDRCSNAHGASQMSAIADIA